MAAVAGTGTSLSASYYLRNFYTANRNAVTSSKRKEMTVGTLSQADATALHRAAKKLRNFNYEDDTYCSLRSRKSLRLESMRKSQSS